jgi:gamma-butyrobetaine dioxygenase
MAYVGEPVSQLEHALQTAALAVEHDASQALIVAALLHDIGHLLDDRPENAANRGIDTRHQEVGCWWLSQYFPASVTLPIRQHVAAKRYLCTVNAEYRARLSPASQQSLVLQGGLMTSSDVEAFEGSPYWRDAVMLRQWDDQAKVPRLVVPALMSYRPMIKRMLLLRGVVG